MSDKESIVEYDINQIGIRDQKDLKQILAANYMKQIENFMGDEQRARRFLSAVMADVQRNPTLLECSPVTLINSYLMMAELELMPSGVSGEAYVLPYNDKRQGMIAQFQLGYQGLVTLFYRSGAKQIIAEIVFKNDTFKYVNGEVHHEVDPFSQRGEAVGAYVIVTLQTGAKVSKVMSKDEIMQIAKKFSKSFNSNFSPWNESQDPQKWMWRKTVLKQAAKLIPKNETIYRAVAADNEDSVIAERTSNAMAESEALKMGNFLKHGQNSNQAKEASGPETENETVAGDATGDTEHEAEGQ